MTNQGHPAVEEIGPVEAAVSLEEARPVAQVSSALPTEDAPQSETLEVTEPRAARSKFRIFTIMSALYLVLFVGALDQTIVATSIPTITSSLHSASGYVWIGSAYLLANAAFSPIWVKCSDIWGRKIILLCAITGFGASSIIAATSVNMPMLIAARGLQGSVGGGLMGLVNVTISDLFSIRERALYMGLLGMVWAVAGASGPLLGGALSQLVSWRWIFWINLPACGLAFVLLLFFLDVHNPRTKFRDGIRAIDWFGTISILAVILLLLLGLDFGGAIFPWNSPKVICLIVFGAAMFGAFLFSEKRLARYPLMPTNVFNSRSNIAVFVVAFLHSIVATGIEYYLPLFFQSVKQVSPLRSGILIIPFMVTAAATDIVAGIITHRTGRYRENIWVGTTIMTLGTGLFIYLRVGSSIALIVTFEMIWGIGVALLFQTPMLALQNTVSQADTASATATLAFARNTSTSLSIVLGGIVFQNSMRTRHHALAATGLSGPTLDALSGDRAAANVGIVKTINDSAQRLAVQTAFAQSIRNMFSMYTGFAAVAIVASVFIQHRHMSKEHTETKTGIDNMTKRDVKE